MAAECSSGSSHLHLRDAERVKSPVRFPRCHPQPLSPPLPLQSQRRKRESKRPVPLGDKHLGGGKFGRRVPLWASLFVSLWCQALVDAAPARRGGRCPFNRRRAVQRRSRESDGGREAVPRLGACGGWSPRWSRRLWRHESVSVRGGAGRAGTGTGGTRRAPSRRGRGTERPLPTPRPRPRRGGAPSLSSDPGVKEDPTRCADPRWELSLPPVRSPVCDPWERANCPCSAPRTPGTIAVSNPQAQTSSPRSRPQVIPLGPGREQASSARGCTSYPGGNQGPYSP